MNFSSGKGLGGHTSKVHPKKIFRKHKIEKVKS